METTSSEQSYWRQAEKDVHNYFISNNCEATILTEKEWQYNDVDIKVIFPDGQIHYVSVKYMQAVAKYCNLSFEIGLYSANGARMDGWFAKDVATLTAIIIPDIVVRVVNGKRKSLTVSNNKRLLLFDSKKLKIEVPKRSSKTTRLTDYQKQFNIGRRFIDAENIIVPLENILDLTLKDIILPCQTTQ